tara:strand:- start:159 stop:1415 length:1257 start_codon:yes stop_codon:yes gene_type:complete
MILKFKSFYNSISNTEKLTLIILLSTPLAFILGNLFINLFLIIIFFNFIYNFFYNYDKKLIIKDQFFLLISFFLLTLLVNLFFSLEPSNSLPRILKIFLILGLVFQIKNFIQNHQIEFERVVFGFWSIIFVLVLFDVIFEVIFGFNTIGFTSYYPGRIASFFNDELIVGSFFLCFVLFTANFFLEKLKKFKKINFFILITLIIISFLIGERANFIKFLISILIFIFIVLKPNWKLFMTGIFLLMISITLIINLSSNHISRYVNALDTIFHKNGVSNYLKESQYGAHYNAAYKIFKDYPIFGIGIKNYRNEVANSKYKNEKYKKTNARWATHPHQIHFEFLSETGLFGYLSFLIFILLSIYISCKKYYKEGNNYQLSSIIFVVVSLVPFLPSGSFFSTFSSGLFWVNYAIMVGYNNNKI